MGDGQEMKSFAKTAMIPCSFPDTAHLLYRTPQDRHGGRNGSWIRVCRISILESRFSTLAHHPSLSFDHASRHRYSFGGVSNCTVGGFAIAASFSTVKLG